MALRAQHQSALLLGVPLALLAGTFFSSTGSGLSLVLLALIATLGLPHGALDMELLRRGSSGRRAVATLTYAGLAATALLAFAAAPRLTLAALLVVAALHFGLEDVDDSLPHQRRLAEAVVRGSLPLVAPALAHPEAVGVLLGAVEGLPPGEPSPLAGALATAGLALVPVALLLVLVRTARALHERRAVLLHDAAEIALLLALFLVLPPLGSFLFYFCAVHAVRHTIELPLPGPARSWGEARARFLLGLPLSLTVIAIGGAAWTALPGPAAETGVRVVFQGLLALTLPHVWLHARTDGSDVDR